MGRSEDLMPTIDRVSIFDRNAEFEGMDFATRAIEVGNYTDRSAVPIYASVTSGTTYQRHGDPSRDALCSNIASLENAKYTLVTASGVASVTLPGRTPRLPSRKYALSFSRSSHFIHRFL